MIEQKRYIIEKRNPAHNLRMYLKINVQGQGSYGQVFLAQHKQTKQLVAIKAMEKRIGEEGASISLIKQISILKKLNHPNIIKLISYSLPKNQELGYIILEYMPIDLSKYIAKEALPQWKTKFIILSILKGLNYCHQKYIIHRDIKPANILLNPFKSLVKIADFGIAKPVSMNPRPNTVQVGALYYQAPQLLVQDSQSTLPIDMWGLGCTFAECLLGNILFKPSIASRISQLNQILKFYDIPNQIRIKDSKDLKKFFSLHEQTQIKFKHQKLQKILSPQGFDLLEKMMKINPKSRITAEQALSHDYFKQRKQKIQLKQQPILKQQMGIEKIDYVNEI